MSRIDIEHSWNVSLTIWFDSGSIGNLKIIPILAGLMIAHTSLFHANSRKQITSKVTINNVKELHPLQMVEYAITIGVDHEPGLNWWVTHTLKKHDAIIALVKNCSSRYLKRMHKFGIECPKRV